MQLTGEIFLILSLLALILCCVGREVYYFYRWKKCDARRMNRDEWSRVIRMIRQP